MDGPQAKLSQSLKLNLSGLGVDETKGAGAGGRAQQTSGTDKGNAVEGRADGRRRSSTGTHSAASTPRSPGCTPLLTPLSTARSYGGRTPRPQPLPSSRAAAGDDMPVTVVVHVRPLVARERAQGCQHCLELNTEDRVLPEVSVKGYAARSFPFDQVYGEGAEPSGKLFGECISPLVEGLFEGYNGTVLAYGQTGAGKTYTMGTHAVADEGRSWEAVIPRATAMIFSKVAELTAEGRCSVAVRVSFFEVYQNSLRDLLATKGNKEQNIEIRERGGTDISVEGHTETAVESAAELEAALQMGIAARATHATGMNEHSSRSHAIFTVSLALTRRRRLDVRPPAGSSGSSDDDDDDAATGEGVEEVDEQLNAKMHLVDLAGSERIKKSGVQGQQQKEAASINLGLLALRNCIEALCERGRMHVPYRSNKLTRLLQDSLGGNARTVMIACVSPADSSMDETVNTLKYASSARSIKNKVVANRDAESGALLALMDEVRMLRAQLAAAREGGEAEGGAATPALLHHRLRNAAEQQRVDALAEERDRWRLRATVAESENAELHSELNALSSAAAVSQAESSEPPFGRNPLFTSTESETAPLPEGGVLHDNKTPSAPLSASVQKQRATTTGMLSAWAPSPSPSSSLSPAPGILHSSSRHRMPRSRSHADIYAPFEPSSPKSVARSEANCLHPLAPAAEPSPATSTAAGSSTTPLTVGGRGHVQQHRSDEAAAGEVGLSGVGLDLSWLPLLRQARMEHEAAVLARKAAAAAALRARLDALTGSVLQTGDARLSPPGNKQEVDTWVADAVCLDSQMADLEQVLDARMASRAACAHELHAIERHIEVLRDQLPTSEVGVKDGDRGSSASSSGSVQDGGGDGEGEEEVGKLGVRAAQLREAMDAHNAAVVQLQSLRLRLQERFAEENDAKVARKRFGWVDPSDFGFVMTAVYNLTRKQRSQLLALRAEKEALREEVAWRNTVLELLTNEVDEARINEAQLAEELHRAASEKVRVLDAYGELQLENAELDERVTGLRSAASHLQTAYDSTVRELTEERALSARVLDSLAALQAASSDYAWETSKVAGAGLQAVLEAEAPTPPSIHAVQSEFATPQGTSLISDDVLEALERAAVEKTKLAKKLGEKEQLLFFIQQQLPQVESICARWNNQQSPEQATKQQRKFSWWWGAGRQSEDSAAAGAATITASFFGNRPTSSRPVSPPPSSASKSDTLQARQSPEEEEEVVGRQDSAVGSLNAAYERLQEAKAAAEEALSLGPNHNTAPRADPPPLPTEPSPDEMSLVVVMDDYITPTSTPVRHKLRQGSPEPETSHASSKVESRSSDTNGNHSAVSSSVSALADESSLVGSSGADGVPGSSGVVCSSAAGLAVREAPQWATNPLGDVGVEEAAATGAATGDALSRGIEAETTGRSETSRRRPPRFPVAVGEQFLDESDEFPETATGRKFPRRVSEPLVGEMAERGGEDWQCNGEGATAGREYFSDDCEVSGSGKNNGAAAFAEWARTGSDCGASPSAATDSRENLSQRTSSARAKAALFERLARKKEARIASVRAAAPMVGRINMQEVHGKLQHSDPVERALPVTPTVFDDRLPPQGQRGYVVQSVDFLESMSQSDDALLLRANGSYSSQTPAINGDDDPVARPLTAANSAHPSE